MERMIKLLAVMLGGLSIWIGWLIGRWWVKEDDPLPERAQYFARPSDIKDPDENEQS